MLLTDKPLNLYQVYENELKLRNYSPRSIKTYKDIVRLFLRYYYPVNSQDLNVEQIRKYLLYLKDVRHLSRAYIDQTINALKFLYVKLYKWESFSIEIPRPKKERKLPIVLSRQEIIKICQSLENPKHRLMVEFMYGSGLRVSEVLQIKVKDIDLDRLTLFVREGKGRKDRLTIFSQNLKEPLGWLISNKKTMDLIFANSSGGKLTTRSVQKFFKEALVKSGIKKDASCHSLRHSFATHLLESGVDIRYIQSLLGHSRLETTNLYTKVRNPHLLNISSPL